MRFFLKLEAPFWIGQRRRGYGSMQPMKNLPANHGGTTVAGYRPPENKKTPPPCGSGVLFDHDT
jgi:hypothetical protein